MSHSYDWIWNVFCFIFWSIECLLLPVVIILCIPVECVTGNITCELPIFWILFSSKHGIEEDFESSADGVPKAFSLGQHHRAGVKICATLFYLLYSLSNWILSGWSWRSFSSLWDSLTMQWSSLYLFVAVNSLNHKGAGFFCVPQGFQSLCISCHCHINS